jgi:ribosomal protein S12 methylthiotransferase accessory factor YcaO
MVSTKDIGPSATEVHGMYLRREELCRGRNILNSDDMSTGLNQLAAPIHGLAESIDAPKDVYKIFTCSAIEKV